MEMEERSREEKTGKEGDRKDSMKSREEKGVEKLKKKYGDWTKGGRRRNE